jgi:PKD repeat protein
VFSDVGWLKESIFGFYYSGVGVYVVLSSDISVVNNSMNAKREYSFDSVYAVYGGIIESIEVSQNQLHRFKKALALAYVVQGLFSENMLTICEYGVELVHVNDTKLMDNILLLGGDFKGYGVVVDYCFNITVGGSLVQNGSIGIAVQRSDLVCVTRNLLRFITPWGGSDYSFGISCYLTSNVSVYHNDLIYNYQHAQDKWSDNNRWDNGYPSGGNFFDDYWGEDADEDGIGDTPYPILGDESEDRYPLMDPIRDIQLPPQANFSYEVLSDRTIRFNAVASRDRDGEIVSYLWDFGDGSTDSGDVVEHSYSSDAYYSVNLTVIDDDGLEDIMQKTVLMDITSPSITFVKPVSRRLYINEQLELPFFKTVIIGKIHVHVDCFDNASGVDSVTLSIDGVSQGEQSLAPFVWLWDEKTPGRFRHTLQVETVDKVGNANTLEIPVLKFF